MPDPADCTSMDDIRAEIDRLDSTLMALFAERWAYIGRAAEIKSGSGLPGRIPARVDQVLDNVRAHAAARGLDPDLYARIWQMVIEASIAHEEDRLG